MLPLPGRYYCMKPCGKDGACKTVDGQDSFLKQKCSRTGKAKDLDFQPVEKMSAVIVNPLYNRRKQFSGVWLRLTLLFSVCLLYTSRMIQAKGWRVNNVDVTIIAQAPKLAAFIPQMQALVAEDLQVAADAVNVKATTTEKLGFAGRGEGIAAEAVASLIQA